MKKSFLQTLHMAVKKQGSDEVVKKLMDYAKQGVRQYYEVSEVLRAYKVFVNQKSHAEKMVVHTTCELDQKQIENIQKILQTPKNIHVEVRQNMDLGMGFIAEYNFKRIDASLKTVVNNALKTTQTNVTA